MSKAIRASALILLLACSARAGYMPNGAPEPPQQSVQAQGEMNCPLVQLALTLLALL